MASFNCLATACSPRGASLRGAGREICSIWRVIEVQPLVNIGYLGGVPTRHHRSLIGWVGRSAGIADCAIEPFVQGHARTSRGGLGPLAD